VQTTVLEPAHHLVPGLPHSTPVEPEKAAVTDGDLRVAVQPNVQADATAPAAGAVFEWRRKDFVGVYGGGHPDMLASVNEPVCC